MAVVLVAGRIHASGLDWLADADGVTLDYVEDAAPGAYLPRLARADALLLRTQPLTAAAIAEAPRLRVVSRHGVGYDAVDLAALDARGIPLAIVGDVNSISVAEHTMLLLLAAAKRLARMDRAVRTGGWSYRDTLEAQEIGGKRLLVIGLGRIGRRVAGLARAFGMEVSAFDPLLAPGAEGDIRVEHDLTAALGAADFVTIHAPKTGGALIGAPEIARMKRGAVLVSAARGGQVDEEPLVEALRSGQLGAAGLDVFATEPPDPANPLLGLDTLVLTPHAAGLTEQSAARMSLAAARNITDFFAGRLDPALVVNSVAINRAG